MKKICMAFALLLVVVLLAGCTKRPATVYGNDYFSMTRQGRKTCISDAQTGEAYTFVTQRVKRPETATEAGERAKTHTLTDTDTLRIETAHGILLITVKSTGETYLFRG